MKNTPRTIWDSFRYIDLQIGSNATHCNGHDKTNKLLENNYFTHSTLLSSTTPRHAPATKVMLAHTYRLDDKTSSHHEEVDLHAHICAHTTSTQRLQHAGILHYCPNCRRPNFNTQVGISPNYSWDDYQVGAEHPPIWLCMLTLLSTYMYISESGTFEGFVQSIYTKWVSMESLCNFIIKTLLP